MKDVIRRTLGAWCLLLAASASQAELVEFRDDDANAESSSKRVSDQQYSPKQYRPLREEAFCLCKMS